MVINTAILRRLQSFKGVSKLKKAAMNMLVKTAEPALIKELHDEFEKMDIDRTGLINADELKIAIQNNHDVHLNDAEVD